MGLLHQKHLERPPSPRPPAALEASVRRGEASEGMTAPKPGGGAAAAARAAAAGPRTVLITGVSRGLGRALALELARRGHAVVGCGRSAEHLRSLEAEITSPSRHFLTVADVVRLCYSSNY